jgi:hypothetical protein
VNFSSMNIVIPVVQLNLLFYDGLNRTPCSKLQVKREIVTCTLTCTSLDLWISSIDEIEFDFPSENWALQTFLIYCSVGATRAA